MQFPLACGLLSVTFARKIEVGSCSAYAHLSFKCGCSGRKGNGDVY